MEDITEKTIQFRNNEKKKREVETFSTALIIMTRVTICITSSYHL